jgi:hypothetical protein
LFASVGTAIGAVGTAASRSARAWGGRMRPRGDELLRSAQWTLEEKVVPALNDPLAVSYLRAVLSLLEQAECRASTEWPTLVSEYDDLRSVLDALTGTDPELDEEIESVLGALSGVNPHQCNLAELEAEVSRLRRPIIRALALGLPAARAYVSREVLRALRSTAVPRGQGF